MESFTEFFALCKRTTKNDKEVLKLIEKRYSECDALFLKSKEFKVLLKAKGQAILQDSANRYIHITDVVKKLKQYKARKSKKKHNHSTNVEKRLANEDSSEDSMTHTEQRSLSAEECNLNEEPKCSVEKWLYLNRSTTDKNGDNTDSQTEAVEHKSLPKGDVSVTGQAQPSEHSSIGDGAGASGADEQINSPVPTTSIASSHESLPGTSHVKHYNSANNSDNVIVASFGAPCREKDSGVHYAKTGVETCSVACEAGGEGIERSTTTLSKKNVFRNRFFTHKINEKDEDSFSYSTGAELIVTSLKQCSVDLVDSSLAKSSIINNGSVKGKSEHHGKSGKDVSGEENEGNSDFIEEDEDKKVCTREEEKTSIKQKAKKASDRQIHRLEKLLEKLDKKIKELEEAELDLEDLDNDNSAYALEDRYKARFAKVWKKLCDLKDRSPRTGRPTEKKFKFEGTRYPEINTKISRFVNKYKEFPDYSDILEIIQKTNLKYHLRMGHSLIESLARDAFTNVGNCLQQRRTDDFIANFGCHITDKYRSYIDPALYDTELKKKLERNDEQGRKKLEEVIEKYAYKQETWNQDTSSDEEEEEPTKDDCDDIKLDEGSEDDEEDNIVIRSSSSKARSDAHGVATGEEKQHANKSFTEQYLIRRNMEENASSIKSRGDHVMEQRILCESIDGTNDVSLAGSGRDNSGDGHIKNMTAVLGLQDKGMLNNGEHNVVDKANQHCVVEKISSYKPRDAKATVNLSIENDNKKPTVNSEIISALSTDNRIDTSGVGDAEVVCNTVAVDSIGGSTGNDNVVTVNSHLAMSVGDISVSTASPRVLPELPRLTPALKQSSDSVVVIDDDPESNCDQVTLGKSASQAMEENSFVIKKKRINSKPSGTVSKTHDKKSSTVTKTSMICGIVVEDNAARYSREIIQIIDSDSDADDGDLPDHLHNRNEMLQTVSDTNNSDSKSTNKISVAKKPESSRTVTEVNNFSTNTNAGASTATVSGDATCEAVPQSMNSSADNSSAPQSSLPIILGPGMGSNSNEKLPIILGTSFSKQPNTLSVSDTSTLITNPVSSQPKATAAVIAANRIRRRQAKSKYISPALLKKIVEDAAKEVGVSSDTSPKILPESQLNLPPINDEILLQLGITTTLQRPSKLQVKPPTTAVSSSCVFKQSRSRPHYATSMLTTATGQPTTSAHLVSAALSELSAPNQCYPITLSTGKKTDVKRRGPNLKTTKRKCPLMVTSSGVVKRVGVATPARAPMHALSRSLTKHQNIRLNQYIKQGICIINQNADNPQQKQLRNAIKAALSMSNCSHTKHAVRQSNAGSSVAPLTRKRSRTQLITEDDCEVIEISDTLEKQYANSSSNMAIRIPTIKKLTIKHDKVSPHFDKVSSHFNSKDKEHNTCEINAVNTGTKATSSRTSHKKINTPSNKIALRKVLRSSVENRKKETQKKQKLNSNGDVSRSADVLGKSSGTASTTPIKKRWLSKADEAKVIKIVNKHRKRARLMKKQSNSADVALIAANDTRKSAAEMIVEAVLCNKIQAPSSSSHRREGTTIQKVVSPTEKFVKVPCKSKASTETMKSSELIDKHAILNSGSVSHNVKYGAAAVNIGKKQHNVAQNNVISTKTDKSHLLQKPGCSSQNHSPILHCKRPSTTCSAMTENTLVSNTVRSKSTVNISKSKTKPCQKPDCKGSKIQSSKSSLNSKVKAISIDLTKDGGPSDMMNSKLVDAIQTVKCSPTAKMGSKKAADLSFYPVAHSTLVSSQSSSQHVAAMTYYRNSYHQRYPLNCVEEASILVGPVDDLHDKISKMDQPSTKDKSIGAPLVPQGRSALVAAAQQFASRSHATTSTATTSVSQTRTNLLAKYKMPLSDSNALVPSEDSDSVIVLD